MVRKAILDYWNHFPNVEADRHHCVNCQLIGMCLALRFAQPEVCPDEVLGKCSHFMWWPRCKKCGERKEDIGRDYHQWICRCKTNKYSNTSTQEA